jgi:hypothetical protein
VKSRRANQARLFQVKFDGDPGQPGTMGTFYTDQGNFKIYTYQLAIIDVSRSVLLGVDQSSLWFLEYRGIPFLGRTGYLTEISMEEAGGWDLCQKALDTLSTLPPQSCEA